MLAKVYSSGRVSFPLLPLHVLCIVLSIILPNAALHHYFPLLLIASCCPHPPPGH